jgi:hypothetical protein
MEVHEHWQWCSNTPLFVVSATPRISSKDGHRSSPVLVLLVTDVNGKAVMLFLSMRRAVSRLLKRIRLRQNRGFSRHDSLSALTAVRSQSDGVQLCLVLGCRSVSERDFFPSPRKKWSLVLSEFSFYLFIKVTSCGIEISIAVSRLIMEGKTKDAQLRDEFWPCRSCGLDF